MGSRIVARWAGIAVLLLIAAPTLQAADFEVVQLNNFLLELRGGSGPGAWHIQYGTNFKPGRYRALAGPGPIAYFSHYNVLRRINLDKGVVTGRWLFPGYAIRFLSWKGSHLQVVVSTAERSSVQRTFAFDPDNPQIPVANQTHAEAARAEALRSYSGLPQIKPADAARIATELENTIRRDPFSPWLQVGLGYLYGVLKNSESARWIDQGIRVDSAHFSELLDISNFLAERGHIAPSRLAFERGHAEFWRAGQDPRLASRLLVANSQFDTPEAVQRELADRAYALSPWVDGAASAWERYGNYFIDKGDAQTGALWLERAKDARDNLLLPTNLNDVERPYLSFAATCSLAGAVLYALLLYSRYRPQRQARLAAARAAGVSRPGFFNVEYWRPSEKLALLLLVAIAWMAEGSATAAVTSTFNRPSFWLFYEMWSDGLLNFDALENPAVNAEVPQSPERDLLLAIAYQRNGRLEEAERLYRTVPQFAESWNNLGVLLKNSGKNEESQAAFERALALRPDFPEAEWNLEKPARGDWVKAHEKYVPGKAMMTVPSRAQTMKALGMSTTGRAIGWSAILKGPLSSGDELRGFYRSRGRLHTGLLIFVAAGTLIMLFIRPREVSQAPPKYQRWLELLFPGTSRAWGFLGAIVLALACYFSSALWPEPWTREYIFYSYSGGNLSQFPIPFELKPIGRNEAFSPIPSLWWLVALLAVNAAVVLLWKWRRK